MVAKAVRGADAPLGGRVVEHEQAAAVVAARDVLHGRQVTRDLGPGPVQRGFQHVDIDQPLIAHQPGAFRRDLLAQHPGRASARRPERGPAPAWCWRRPAARRPRIPRRNGSPAFPAAARWVRQAHPRFLAFVAVGMHLHGGRVPDVPAAGADIAARHGGHALAADADLQHVGVLAQVPGALAGVDHVDGHVGSRRQAQAGRARVRMHDEGGAAAVVRLGRVDQAGDFRSIASWGSRWTATCPVRGARPR